MIAVVGGKFTFNELQEWTIYTEKKTNADCLFNNSIPVSGISYDGKNTWSAWKKITINERIRVYYYALFDVNRNVFFFFSSKIRANDYLYFFYRQKERHCQKVFQLSVKRFRKRGKENKKVAMCRKCAFNRNTIFMLLYYFSFLFSIESTIYRNILTHPW